MKRWIVAVATVIGCVAVAGMQAQPAKGKRINRAIELLTETELELKVVARRAGFGTQSYMNAVFKERLGKTPGSFRRAGRPGSINRDTGILPV